MAKQVGFSLEQVCLSSVLSDGKRYRFEVRFNTLGCGCSRCVHAKAGNRIKPDEMLMLVQKANGKLVLVHRVCYLNDRLEQGMELRAPNVKRALDVLPEVIGITLVRRYEKA